MTGEDVLAALDFAEPCIFEGCESEVAWHVALRCAPGCRSEVRPYCEDHAVQLEAEVAQFAFFVCSRCRRLVTFVYGLPGDIQVLPSRQAHEAAPHTTPEGGQDGCESRPDPEADRGTTPDERSE